jgi:predicted AAA+ superfamily ATPase
MDLETLIYQQNPQWLGRDYEKPEANWSLRPSYKEILSWLDKRLVVALTGLRRTGKTTLLNQVKYYLEERIDNRQVVYFSFEKSQVKFHPDSLREILNWYFEVFLKIPPQKLNCRVYIFLDEIQYIPFWQDVLKTFYDQSQRIKFLISGSASLFIKKRSAESLAGRLMEIIVPPLSFAEFRKIKGVFPQNSTLSLFKMRPKFLISHFEDYLSFGQFPELVQENYSQEQAVTYLSLVEEKILEQDLPKIYPIQRVDILRLIFNFLKASPGSLIEYRNLANDLGIDLKTTVKYFSYLEKAYLIDFCLNKTKKAVKTARTAKKIYLGSPNFSPAETPQKVENYIYGLLRRKTAPYFFRQGNFEVDFLVNLKKEAIPVEVKYREKIAKEDYRSLCRLAEIQKSKRVYFVSKSLLKEEKSGGITICTIPACLFAEEVDTFRG